MDLRTLFLPYDLYERHLVVSRLLKEQMSSDGGDGYLLDVGGRAELLERFTSQRVLSVNVDGSGDLLGSGYALPFGDGAFIAVVSIDTLEHLPRQHRLPLLRECLRVARRCVVVAAPFGSAGHTESERRLDKLYRSEYGEPHLYLNEHLRFGLSNRAELDRLVRDLKTAAVQRYFAGDYVRQGKWFERTALGYRKGVLARLSRYYNWLSSLALFNPIRLQAQPYPTANRFYLLLEKSRDAQAQVVAESL